MGEARRRGTRDERVAQSIARREAWEKQQAAERARLRAERQRLEAERLKLRSPQERKEAVFIANDRHATSALLHALLASSVQPYRRRT